MMNRIDRIRRGGKGEMVKRVRGIEKAEACVILLPFTPLPFSPLPPFFSSLFSSAFARA
jgi:hypothetical protein